MKTLLTAILPVALGFAATAQDAPDLSTDTARGSYAFGANIGRNLQPFAASLDFDLFVRGLQDALKNQDLAMEPAAIETALGAFQRKAMDDMRARNSAEGKAYLEKNAEDKDVVVLPSGLQYKILTAGEGDKPKPTDRVSVHYTGTLIDGTTFDSSRERGSPAAFPVNGVIQGWQEGLQLMPAGSRWMLYIPSNLAYGERGSPPRIAPNSTLVFDVELLGIQ